MPRISIKTTALQIMLFVSLLSGINCSKRETEDGGIPAIEKTGKNQLKADAHYLDSLAIINISETNVTVKLGATPIPLKAGAIILGGPSKNAPDGFLRKIINVSDGPTETTFNTTYASLNEAFEELYINAEYLENSTKTMGVVVDQKNTFNQIVNVKSAKASKALASEKNEIIMGANLKFNINQDLKSIPGLKLNGTLNLNISSIKCIYTLSPESLTPEKFLLQVDLNTGGSNLEITNDSNTSVTLSAESDFLPPVMLPTFYIPIPILTPLGPVIWPLPLKHKIAFKTGPITISGKAKWNLALSTTAELGVKYQDGNTDVIKSLAINATALQPDPLDFVPSISLNAKLTVVKYVYEISPFGTDALKGFFAIPNQLDFTANLTENPNYTLKYQLGVSGGISTRFWIGDQNSIALNVNLFEKTIVEGNWKIEPHSIAIIGGNKQTGALGQKLAQSLQVIVKDKESNILPGITVEWRVKAGGGVLSKAVTATDEKGIAMSEWTLGNEGLQAVEATIKKADNVLEAVTFYPYNYYEGVWEATSISVFNEATGLYVERFRTWPPEYYKQGSIGTFGFIADYILTIDASNRHKIVVHINVANSNSTPYPAGSPIVEGSFSILNGDLRFGGTGGHAKLCKILSQTDNEMRLESSNSDIWGAAEEFGTIWPFQIRDRITLRRKVQ